MLIGDFIPVPSVSEFVQFYRIVHFEFDKSESVPFKAYPPKPEQVLHFFLRDPVAIENTDKEIFNQPPVLFIGQSTSLVKLINGNNLLDVQIVFQPTAVFRLTSIPAYELTNQYLDGTHIFKKSIQCTFEQLQLAKTYKELIQIVNNFVLDLIYQACAEVLPIDFTSRQMIKSGGNVSVDSLAKKSYLCTRQFRRKFYEGAGVNPKTYLRIIHFNKAYNFKNWYSNNDWSSIATECGYSDYQHLSKDYQELTGLTPPQLHLQESNSPENVLGLAKKLYHNRLMATQASI
jgi:AraC-like DNA-binding protein